MYKARVSNRGSLLIVIMGMIVLMLAVTMGVAVRVRQGIVNSGTIGKQAQAAIMLSAAKLYINYTTTAAITITSVDGGDDSNLTTSAKVGKPLASSMGWFHLKKTAATQYTLFCVGGPGGLAPAKGSGTTEEIKRAQFQIPYYFTYDTTGPVCTPYWESNTAGNW